MSKRQKNAICPTKAENKRINDFLRKNTPRLKSDVYKKLMKGKINEPENDLSV